MALDDGVGDGLQQHGLAGARRRYDEAALTEADRHHKIQNARGVVRGVGLEVHLAFGIKRGQVVKKDLVAGDLGVFVVRRFDFEQGEIALGLLGLPDLARNGVAGAQAEPPDLGGRHVDVVGAGQVVGAGRAQEPESVRQNLQGSLPVDHPVFLYLVLQQSEHQLLLAHVGGAFDVEALGHLHEFADFFLFEFGDVH